VILNRCLKMASARMAAVVVAGLVMMACTGNPTLHAPSGESSTPTRGPCVTAEKGHEWCDETDVGGEDNASIYQDARTLCDGMTVEELARQMGTRDNALDAAEALAKRYRAEQPALEGCMDGLRS
jgi:hypothetical protein